MKKQPWLRLAAVLASLALVAAACGGDDDDDSASETTEPTETSAPEGDGSLKIGTLLPQTGQLDFLGPPMFNGVRLAVEEINAAGGVLGQDVVLVERDDGTDPDVANAAADELLTENVDVVVGAAASSVSLAVIDKLTGAPVVQCSPSNTGLQFTDYDDDGYYFRTAPPDNLQSQVLTDLMVGDGVESAVIVARSDEYGEGFANALRDELENAGVTVADPILYDPEAGNYQAEAQQIADAEGAVALISFAEGGQVITAAIAAGQGPADREWYGVDGIADSAFFEEVDANNPAVVEGIRGTVVAYEPASGEATFAERFEAFAPPDTGQTYAATSYDCVVIPALAAIAAGSDAPQAIAAEMNGVTRDGTECTLFEECAQLLADGEDIDYLGASGLLEFIDAGEPGAGEYQTWEFGPDGALNVLEASIEVGEG
jgi:branched-chain amino acid transport system substrate-binding protein